MANLTSTETDVLEWIAKNLAVLTALVMTVRYTISKYLRVYREQLLFEEEQAVAEGKATPLSRIVRQVVTPLLEQHQQRQDSDMRELKQQLRELAGYVHRHGLVVEEDP